VYPASFAAVPHVVRILSVNPTEAGAPYFQFPAWVEICRQREPIEIPADLHTAYREALARLPGLAVAALQRERDDDLLRVALSAIAAAKGAAVVAEAAMELTPEVATEFMQWLGER
jgi:hypothetical protein